MKNDLAKKIYNTLALGKFMSLREKGEVDIEKFLLDHEKNWPKYRGDLRQLAKLYENNRSNSLN